LNLEQQWTAKIVNVTGVRNSIEAYYHILLHT